MTQARRSSKRKRGKAALVFGAAGVSLAMTGVASATAPATNVPLQDNIRQFILGEEEISDVSLATFHIFDRENPSLSQDIKEARGGCGRCGGGGGRCAGAGVGRCAGAGVGRCAGAGRWSLRRCWRWSLRGRPLRCRPLRRRCRTRLFGLCRRLHRNLHAMGPEPGPVGQRLLLKPN